MYALYPQWIIWTMMTQSWGYSYACNSCHGHEGFAWNVCLTCRGQTAYISDKAWMLCVNISYHHESLLSISPNPSYGSVARISYSYTMVRVYDIVVITRVRGEAEEIIITMISYKYTRYNWLVPWYHALLAV